MCNIVIFSVRNFIQCEVESSISVIHVFATFVINPHNLSFCPCVLSLSPCLCLTALPFCINLIFPHFSHPLHSLYSLSLELPFRPPTFHRIHPYSQQTIPHCRFLAPLLPLFCNATSETNIKHILLSSFSQTSFLALNALVLFPTVLFSFYGDSLTQSIFSF